MAWASPTTINGSQGFDSVIPYLNTVTQFWFGRMLMITIFMIFLFGYVRAKNEDWIGGFAVASYVTFVIGLMFWVIGMVTGLDFAIIIGISVISTVILFTQRER